MFYPFLGHPRRGFADYLVDSRRAARRGRRRRRIYPVHQLEVNTLQHEEYAVLTVRRTVRQKGNPLRLASPLAGGTTDSELAGCWRRRMWMA